MKKVILTIIFLITLSSSVFASDITKIEVFPKLSNMELNTSTTVKAYVYYDDNSFSDITSSALWTSSDESKITVNGGILNAVALGSSDISVSYQGKTDALSIEVVSVNDMTNIHLANIENWCKYIFALIFVFSFLILVFKRF